MEYTYLRHILDWAGEVPFYKADGIDPTLPEYLLSARRNGEHKQLSAEIIKKTLATARWMFYWFSDNQEKYSRIKSTWIGSLKAKRLLKLPPIGEVVRLEEILEIAKAPAIDTQERRIRAAACFWYLSGIRIGAFVTLPIMAVDIQKRVVLQYPTLGVRTKNNKYAKTFLLPIPELLGVVQDWDQEIRQILPDNGKWFAHLAPDTREIDPGNIEPGKHRSCIARLNLKEWLDKVGLPYHSPHKFRHGHIHWKAKHAKDWADYKAVSMNVMHSNTSITDQVYSRLKGDDIQNRLETMGEENSTELENELKLLQEFIEWKAKKQ